MSSPQHEPTMEEILASIRKIISEDNPEPAPAAASSASPAEAPDKPDLEVLELTQEVVEEPKPQPEVQAQAPAQPEPAPPPPPVQETREEIVFEPVSPRESQPAPANDGIFSDQTRKALEESFAAIPDEPEERPRQAPAAPGSSVESVFERAVKESFVPVLEQYLSENTGLVIERLTPLIRAWMDENFPPLLENAVKSEMDRIARLRGRR